MFHPKVRGKGSHLYFVQVTTGCRYELPSEWEGHGSQSVQKIANSRYRGQGVWDFTGQSGIR